MNGSKIRMIRELRGFSQENIAAKIGITQTSYSRIENNQTKLDTAILDKLAKELGVTPIDILSREPTIVNFVSQTDDIVKDRLEDFYAFQKDMIEKIILSKDNEICSLKEAVNRLLKDKELLIKLLQSNSKLNWRDQDI